MRGRVAYLVSFMNIGALFQEKLHDIAVTFVASQVEHCKSILHSRQAGGMPRGTMCEPYGSRV